MKKRILIGTAAAIAAVSAAAYASDGAAVINAVYNNIKIVINGEQITPTDASGKTVEPFIADGTTYLPVRAVSEALGKNVSWDGGTNTVSIDNADTTIDTVSKGQTGITFSCGDLIYENALDSPDDVEGFVMEGDAKVSFDGGVMQLEGNLDPSLGQASNYVYWCNERFPDSVIIEWDFKPLTDDGLAIMFFSADGQNGKDLFDPSLAKRTGEYKQYHSGDINAYHVSYFRHSTEDESGFRVCNLRKSAGFHMVAQGADPLPPVSAVRDGYTIKVVKDKEIVQFYIKDKNTGIELMPFEFVDDGTTWGDFINDGGYIGFRQKTPLVAEYSNLKVYKAVRN